MEAPSGFDANLKSPQQTLSLVDGDTRSTSSPPSPLPFW